MPDLEGWINEIYVRIYDNNKLVEINNGYNVNKYIPGHKILGSSDLGDALVIDESTGKLHWIPFVPLDIDHKFDAYESLQAFMKIVNENMKVNDPSRDDHYGLEVHYKHPVVMGGDMWDKNNVVFPKRDVHMKLCEHWNELYYRLKAKAN